MNHYLMADGSFYSSVADYDRKMFADEVAGRDPRLSQTVLCPGYIQVGATKVTANDLTAITGYQPIKYVGNANYDGSKKRLPTCLFSVRRRFTLISRRQRLSLVL